MKWGNNKNLFGLEDEQHYVYETLQEISEEDETCSYLARESCKGLLENGGLFERNILSVTSELSQVSECS